VVEEFLKGNFYLGYFSTQQLTRFLSFFLIFRDRNNSGLTDECYAYGELDYETFATLLTKVMKAYGVYTKVQHWTT
jgi:hypothetical protein